MVNFNDLSLRMESFSKFSLKLQDQDVAGYSAEREISFFRNRPLSDQEFIGLRKFVLPTDRQIVKDIFDQFVGDKEITAAEFGCGAEGCFYNLLLPNRFKKNWRQYDINPFFVEHNRRSRGTFFQNRKAIVEVGNIYQMPFSDGTLDVI